MYCPKCNQENPSNSCFCCNCGTPITSVSQNTSTKNSFGHGQQSGVILTSGHKKLILSWLAMLIAFIIPYGYLSVNSHHSEWNLISILFTGDLTSTFGMWLFVITGLGALILCFKSQYQLAYTMQLISFVFAVAGHIFFDMFGDMHWGYSTFAKNIRLGYFLVVAISAFQFLIIHKLNKVD